MIAATADMIAEKESVCVQMKNTRQLETQSRAVKERQYQERCVQDDKEETCNERILS